METPNAVRKLYQLNRVETVAAIMHDFVLVPEGRSDHEWLKLLLRAVDLRQGWSPEDESRFGSYVGVVMTQDAAIVATVAEMARLHRRVVALVDGDQAGLSYASALAAAVARPAVIMRWPDNWSIEDAIGWILDGETNAIGALATAITSAPSTISELVARLKSEDRATNGLKQDRISYEAVANIIGSTEGCCRKARDLLNAITDVVLGNDNQLFLLALTEGVPIYTFRP
jgi:hypothetical protein